MNKHMVQYILMAGAAAFQFQVTLLFTEPEGLQPGNSRRRFKTVLFNMTGEWLMKKTSFGMVGGGLGSFIGDVHRHGAMIDDLAALRAGCFSRSREKSLETARAWDIPEDRVYGTFQEMADRESARDDGIDFVTVATPNSSHYEIAKYFWKKISTSCVTSLLR